MPRHNKERRWCEMYIDCDTYLILARTGHPAERHIAGRDDVVGLSAARVAARRLRARYPDTVVDVFRCKGTGRFLVDG